MVDRKILHVCAVYKYLTNVFIILNCKTFSWSSISLSHSNSVSFKLIYYPHLWCGDHSFISPPPVAFIHQYHLHIWCGVHTLHHPQLWCGIRTQHPLIGYGWLWSINPFHPHITPTPTSATEYKTLAWCNQQKVWSMSCERAKIETVIMLTALLPPPHVWIRGLSLWQLLEPFVKVKHLTWWSDFIFELSSSGFCMPQCIHRK